MSILVTESPNSSLLSKFMDEWAFELPFLFDLLPASDLVELGVLNVLLAGDLNSFKLLVLFEFSFGF